MSCAMHIQDVYLQLFHLFAVVLLCECITITVVVGFC